MMNDDTMGMDTALRSVQVPLLDRTFDTEVVEEFSLPDYQPEIKRLLRIEADPLPPTCQPGGNGMDVDGRLDLRVLYLGHDDQLYCAPLSTRYHLEAPFEDTRDFAMEEPILCLCDPQTEVPVGRVTAPRRMNIRCRINAPVKVYGEYRPESAARSGDTTTESLSGTAEVGRVCQGLSELLPLQDDLILPPSPAGEWRVVCAEGQVMVTEALPMAGQVSCRGEVTMRLTLCPAETAEEFASDTPAPAPEPTILQRKLPFTQTVEMENVTPGSMATARGYCTDISVQMEEGQVHMDMGVLVEARAQHNETVSYVKDIYSTRRDSTARYATYPTQLSGRALCGNFTLSDSLALSDTGIDPGARVVDVTAVAVPEALVADPDKGRCVLTGTCRAHLLLMRDGEYNTADIRLPFRYELDHPALSAGDGEATLAYDGGVDVVTCRARMDGERVGLDAELAVSLRTCSPAPITLLTDIDFGEQVTRRRGEYVICFPAPTDTLWEVGKRYHAPMAALTAANNLPAAPADEVESLSGVNYLIV